MNRFLSVFLAFALVLVFAAAAAGDDKTKSDDYIYDQVRIRLANEPLLKGGKVDVEVKEGIVTLLGTVASDKALRRAESRAKRVSGVKRVVNNLKVVKNL